MALSVVAVALMWIPHIATDCSGGAVACGGDLARDVPHKAEWAVRARRTHGNAVENIAVFAPLTLLVVLVGAASTQTALAALVYFGARLVHFIAYTLAGPVLRVLSFLLGWGATMIMVATLLT